MSFQCPYCEILLKIPPDFAGKNVKCSKCKNAFRTPDEIFEVYPKPHTSALLEQASDENQRSSAKSSDKSYDITCPDCDARLPASLENAGGRAQCPSCQTLIRIPAGLSKADRIDIHKSSSTSTAPSASAAPAGDSASPAPDTPSKQETPLPATTDSEVIPSPDQKPALKRDYWAFISYRHVDNREEGREWATWLHQSLETYEVPEDLVGTLNDEGRTIPSRIYPVFRDEDELGAGNDLTGKIYSALDNAQTLVVICSPKVISSKYVDKEIRYFKALGKGESILAGVIAGDPGGDEDSEQNCFPNSLLFGVNSNGELLKERHCEPIAADFRLLSGNEGWTSPEAYKISLLHENRLTPKQVAEAIEKYSRRLDLAKLKIISGVLKIPLGVLQKRDQSHQLEIAKKRAKILRNWLMLVGAMACMAIISAFGFFVQRNHAEQARKKEETQRQIAIQNEKTAKEQTIEAGKQKQLAETMAAKAEAKSVEADKQRRTAELMAERANAETEKAKKLNVGLEIEVGKSWYQRAKQKIEEIDVSGAGSHLCNVVTYPDNELLAARAISFKEFGPNFSSGSEEESWRDKTGFSELLRKEDPRSIREFKDCISMLSSTQGRIRPLLYWSSPRTDFFNRSIENIVWNSRGDFFTDGARIWSFPEGEVAVVLEKIEESEKVSDPKWNSAGTVVSCVTSRGLSIWDVGTGKLITSLFREEKEVIEYDWNPIIDSIVAGFDDGLTVVFDVENENSEQIGGLSGRVAELRWSPNGRFIVSRFSDGKINIWNVKEKNLIFLDEIAQGESENDLVKWSPQGELSIIKKEYIEIRGANGFNLIERIGPFEHQISAFDWDKSGNRLVFGMENGNVAIYERRKKKTIRLCSLGESVRKVSWAPESEVITAETAVGRRLSLIDVENRKEIYQPNWLVFGNVSWHPKGSHAFLSSPNQVYLWDNRKRSLVEQNGTPNHGFVAWHPGGKIISYSSGNTVELWDSSTGKKLRDLWGHEGTVLSLSWNGDGSKLASGSADGEVKVWKVDDEIVELFSFDHREGGEAFYGLDIDTVMFVTWSPDDKFLLTGADDGKLRVWSSDGTEKMTIDHIGPGNHNSRLSRASWSPDGRHFALSTHHPNSVEIWSAKDWKVVKSLELRGESPNRRNFFGCKEDVGICWSPDGGYIAACSHNQGFTIWRASDYKEDFHLDQSVVGCEWGKDGKTMFTWSNEEVQIWRGYVLVGKINRHGGLNGNVSSSPDCSRLAIASKNLELWDLRNESEISLISEEPEDYESLSTYKVSDELLGGSKNDFSDYRHFNRYIEFLCEPSQGGVWVYGGNKKYIWSPDYRFLAVCNTGNLKIFDDKNERLLPQVGDEYPHSLLNETLAEIELKSSFRIDGSWCPETLNFAYCVGKTVTIYSPQKKEQLLAHNEKFEVSNLSWHPKGRILMFGGFNGAISLFDTETERCRWSFNGNSSEVRSIHWDSRGELAYVVLRDKSVLAIKASTGELVYRFAEHRSSICAIDFCRETGEVATGSVDGEIFIWNPWKTDTIQRIAHDVYLNKDFTGGDEPFFTLEWSDGGKYINSFSGSREFRRWLVLREPEFSPDFSTYWANENLGRNLFKWNASENSVQSIDVFSMIPKSFPIVNVRPGSITDLMAKSTNEKRNIEAVVDRLVSRGYWMPAWVWFAELNEKQKKQWAPKFFGAFSRLTNEKFVDCSPTFARQICESLWGDYQSEIKEKFSDQVIGKNGETRLER